MQCRQVPTKSSNMLHFVHQIHKKTNKHQSYARMFTKPEAVNRLGFLAKNVWMEQDESLNYYLLKNWCENNDI